MKVADNVCRGIAFEFPDAQKAEILSYLEEREGETFRLCEVLVRIEGQAEVAAFVPLYNGKNVIEGKTLDQLAEMVMAASGADGTCLAYVKGIAENLSALGIGDPAVTELWDAVNALAPQTTLPHPKGASMIKHFDTIKTQLKELAEVINAFKSEAVQLRIIDLVIGGVPLEAELKTPAATVPRQETQKRRTNRRSRKPKTDPAATGRALTKGRPGGKVTLETLVADNFFKTPKAIGEIVEHCDTSLALKYKQSDFSGPLMRLVREKKLTRKKNSDGQYEYVAS